MTVLEILAAEYEDKGITGMTLNEYAASRCAGWAFTYLRRQAEADGWDNTGADLAEVAAAAHVLQYMALSGHAVRQNPDVFRSLGSA